MDKYCPAKRYGYKAKAYAAMKIIYYRNRKKWKKIEKFLSHSQQQPIQKALKKMRSYVLTSDKHAVLTKKINDATRNYNTGKITKEKYTNIEILKSILIIEISVMTICFVPLRAGGFRVSHFS